MFKHPKLVVWLVLLIALGGCVGAQPDAARSVCRGAGVAADGACNVIEGYRDNTAAASLVAITINGGGQVGFPNQVTADIGTISGGIGNQAGELATVGGGSSNVAGGFRSTIGGGARNFANRDSATIGGGYANIATGDHAVIGGGNVNAALEVNATVGGGAGNIAAERYSTVGGGTGNTAGGFIATIAGGLHNTISAAYATVGGGMMNVVSGTEATVGGGAGNMAGGDLATIAGGLYNRVAGNYSTISGGRSNIAGNMNGGPADATYATVGGGTLNIASGSFSIVPGGLSNVAAGDSSFAAGRRANVNPAHPGAFLYADSNDVDFCSAAANEFAARATGGVRFVTAIDAEGNPTAGVRLAGGSGSWASLSDRNAKTDFAPIDAREILGRLMRLPLTTWRYKTQASSVRHIGPTAQDWAALGVGEDDGYINSVDADGIALAAIQGLDQIVQEKDAQIKAQQQQIEAMKAQMADQQNYLAALDARLKAVEQRLLELQSNASTSTGEAR